MLTIADSFIADNLASANNSGGGGIYSSGTLTLLRSTVRGHSSSPQGGGGGIENPGVMTITDSTISGNFGTESGGGIRNGGTLTVTNSTIAENHAEVLPGGGGGGIANNGTVTVTNSTIAGNLCNFNCDGGGGLFNEGGRVELQNTILARNQSSTEEGPVPGPDCFGPVTSLGTTLIGDTSGCDVTLQADDLTGDPGLGAFVDDNTPGRGHFPLLASSRAIDAGTDDACPPTDQLGQPRVGRCDIGAIEFQHPIVLVNDSVSFEPSRPTFRFTPDPTGCPTESAFVGTFRFAARLTNTSAHLLSDLFVTVVTLTNGNLLQNAEGPPFDVGARLTVPHEDGFSDGLLSPEQSVDVPFLICVTEREPFTFVVDVFGVVETSAEAHARVRPMADRRTRGWALPPE